MKLLQMTYLIALKEEGSFSGAAQKLYTSQPSVSSSIKELEEELGCMLVTRESRGVRFTEKGEAVLAQAEAIMAAVKKIKNIALEDDGLKYPVRLGTTPALANAMLWELNRQIEQDNPGLMMTMHTYTSVELLEKVKHQELDVAILLLCDLPISDIEEAVHQGFEFRHLFSDRLMVTCRQGHPLTELEEPTMEQVLEYPLVAFHDSMEEDVRRLLLEYRYSQRIIQINDLIGFRRFICNSDAIAVQTVTAMKNGNENLAEYQMVPLNVPRATWEVSVCMVYKKREFTRAEELVINALQANNWPDLE